MAEGNSEKRADGRLAGELRTIQCDAGRLKRADGSARWTSGETCVLAGVFGPRGMGMAAGGLSGGGGPADDPMRASLAVMWSPVKGQAGPQERYYESIVLRCIDSVLLSSLLPRTQIQLQLQVVQDGGSLLSVGINAAIAALLDAGLPLACLPVACQCAILPPPRSSILLDPSVEEEQAAKASVLIVLKAPSLSPANNSSIVNDASLSTAQQTDRSDVITYVSTGSMTVSQHLSSASLARLACERANEVMRRMMEGK